MRLHKHVLVHALGPPIVDYSECMTKWFQKLDYSFFYQDISQVMNKYEALAVIESEERPKISGEELLGMIGGHLSLFLGMSLLSFVERRAKRWKIASNIFIR